MQWADAVEAYRREVARHDCSETREYVATYGAPGIGQHWVCTVCNKDWQKIGSTWIDLTECPPEELSIEDVR